MESDRQRIGYYDFKAYTEQLPSGRYQGFVLVRHHTLAGTVQTVFRAGRATTAEENAFASAEIKTVALIRIASETPARYRNRLLRVA